MRKKFFYKIISLWVAFIIGFSPLLSLTTPRIYATDSPEEIAREAEEARREAERHAAKQAEKEARLAAEAAREAIEDATPTPIPPTPQPQPTSQPDPTPTTETTATNENTGANSTNDAQSSSSTNADINNNNTGTVNNNVDTTANTGNNVISGDAPPATTPTPTPQQQQNPLPKCEDNLTKEASNGGEENTFSAESADVAGNSDTTTSTQQPSQETNDSSSESTSTDNDTVTVTNTNCVAVSNDQDVSATTGGNNASGNDGSVMDTGSSSADSSLINEGNKNTTSGEKNTTADNQNVSTTEDRDKVTVENNNQIYAENNVSVESSSGGNTLMDNDGQAQLSTGDVDMIVTLLNILNVNITGEDFTHLIVNIFGDLNGEVDLDKIAKSLGMNEEEIQAIARNEQTEAESNNDVKNSQSLNADVNNNNDAQFRNDVDVLGESGNNNLSGNEDRVNLVTGRIKILVALINFINTNYTGTDWYFAMVNIFGNLTGDLILPDPNGFLIDDTKAQNTNTGEGSSNNAQSTSEENITVSDTNQVTLTNNLEVTGDSGSNVAYANEDRVKQESGDVNVVTNLSNWLNVNIIGNNWILLVINVFGKWYGKIIGFPGQGDIDAPESGMLMVAAGGTNSEGPAVAENESTGEGSTNDATFENSENTNVNNNNQAVGENNVKVEGISGGNTTNQNEDPVSVSTGWIDISANLLNIINMNVTGKHWMLVIVNIFGNFLGDITFPGAKKPPVLAEFSQQNSDNETNNEETYSTGGVTSTDTNREEQTTAEQTIITPTPKAKIEIITAVNTLNREEENKIIEVFKADPQNQQTNNENNENRNNEVKILGISVTASSGLQQTFFLIALLAYLIALRFWAFKKSA